MEHDEEIVPEPESLAGDESGAETGEAALKKLRERVKQALAEKQEYLDLSQRLRADYLNLQKTSAAEKTETAKYAEEGLLYELLDLADSFELALGNEKALKAVPENWRRGVEYIYSKLEGIFKNHELEPLAPAVGAPFDPETAQAIEQVATAQAKEDHTVTSLVQKGYKLRGRVIRPAKVKVAVYQESK